MSDEIIRAMGPECHEGVTRGGQFEPCNLPAVALRIDPESHDPYRVCTRHAKARGTRLVTLPEIEAAVTSWTIRVSGLERS